MMSFYNSGPRLDIFYAYSSIRNAQSGGSKWNMVNDVPENDDFDCLNPMSSWRCGLWSPHSSPYSLQVLEQCCYY